MSVPTLEQRALEQCLVEAQKRLRVYRETENDILEATTEADINDMLDKLHELYERRSAP